MILSDICIHKATKREHNALIIDPPFERKALQPASLDITLGAHVTGLDSFHQWANNGTGLIEEYWQPWEAEMDAAGIILAQGEFILGTTEQTFTIPDDMCAQLSGKSSLARMGLQVHATAGWIDPDFKGKITLEMSNLSRAPLRLVPGMYIAQLVFMEMCCPPLHPYGSQEAGSHYQGQSKATRSYLEAGN